MKSKNIIIAACLTLSSFHALAIDCERLVTAIGKAENSKSYPFGVMIQCRNPRQICMNTVKHAEAKWTAAGKPGDFIVFLSKTYAPQKALNDPNKLNKNWTKNVHWSYDARRN